MRNIIYVLIILISFSSCKSTKRAKVTTKKERVKNSKTNESKIPPVSTKIVKNAQYYSGTRYKYGGNSKKGMDCSGLVYVSFQKENISTPRTTKELSKTGTWIDLKKVKKGDLLFFATKKNSRKINHVGIVTSTKNGVKFIHASTSRGVITSSLTERYWYFAFVQARRLL
ncbi:C40 family peptidase [Pontimicrobium sp. IMCC45349]|uniref:C40 family peptidase n=1 Tax=Pontimicrobium sp. IMCC45349 TaxID=3391574 RepID=UPI0039A31227